MINSDDICSPRVGQYCGVVANIPREVGDRVFRVVGYRSYSAMGFIGPEYNGIAVLDETNRDVLLDGHMQCSSGYSLDVIAIRREAARIANLPEADFAAFVQDHPRSRNPEFSLDTDRETDTEKDYRRDPIRRTVRLLRRGNLAYKHLWQQEFYARGREACARIAEELNLKPGTYEIRTNPGGIAVAGEVTLHHEKFYLQFGQRSGREAYILLRECEGLRDFTGGTNSYLRTDFVAKRGGYVVDYIRNYILEKE